MRRGGHRVRRRTRRRVPGRELRRLDGRASGRRRRCRGDGGGGRRLVPSGRPVTGRRRSTALTLPRLRSPAAISTPHGAGRTMPSRATAGWYQVAALIARARVAIADGEPEQAERDAHEALTCTASRRGVRASRTFWRSSRSLAGDAGSHREAARLFGAADAIRRAHRRGALRDLPSRIRSSVDALRNAMGDEDFEAAWAEGAALSRDEAIAYAQRGRGERKRPSSGWGSLTPAELDVVRLVSEGPGQQGHRHAALRVTADRAIPPHPRLHEARADLPRATRPGGHPPLAGDK